MLLSLTSRAVLAASLGLTLATATGCGGRWQPATSHEVASASTPQATYGTVLEVAQTKGYTVVSKDAAAKTARLQAQSSAKSFIDVAVVKGQVTLWASGALVRGDKVHRALQKELSSLELELRQRLGGGAAPTTSTAAPGDTAAAGSANSASVPQAWSEPAYDPSVWGNGNFTCLPVKVPQEHQAALSIKLTNGERADLQLSLAYAPELCRSPAQCKLAGGCPALGIGDADRVHRLAGRLSRGEIGAQATLLDGEQAVANIDLTKHGSIVQALSEIKR
jgi:hypothetical protein